MTMSLFRHKKMLILMVVGMLSCYAATFILTPIVYKATFIRGMYKSTKSNLFHQQLRNHNRDQFTTTEDRGSSKTVNHTTLPSAGYGSCSRVHSGRHTSQFKEDAYAHFTDKYRVDQEPVGAWFATTNRQYFCDDRYVIYSDKFAVAHDVLMRPSQIINKNKIARGGEEVRHVIGQTLDKEEYNFARGFLELNCSDSNSNKGRYEWLSKVNFTAEPYLKRNNSTHLVNTGLKYERRFTVAIERIDYANLHNWAREVYNFLLFLMHFNVQPNDAMVLFLDGHPFTNLDSTWQTIFGTVNRVGHFEKPMLFRHLVLGFKERDGIVSEFRMNNSAYLEECRSVILQQHNLNPISELRCASPTITLIIRRNAVFHPRNLEGNVGRKIYNEAELIDALMTSFPGACVQSVLMEALPMRSQLEIISQTDLLVGMHGAGMTHALFLPRHAAVVEMFAREFKSGRPWYVCFQSIARWRGLQYDSWENFNSNAEMPNDFTIVPVDDIVNKAKKLLRKLCM